MSPPAVSETGRQDPIALPGKRPYLSPEKRTPFLPAAWILLCAWAGFSGWSLSALHVLNRAGYAIAISAAVAGALCVWKRTGAPRVCRGSFSSLRARFRRPVPFGFLALAVLAFVGGALYAPNNHDALSSRTTRVFYWLAQGHWYWVHTDVHNLNTRSCGIEWLTAPLIAFTHTDRFIFLINIVCYLLLPGRIFSLFTRLGVRARTAWQWMWIVPTGYCYLLQAGSIGNDLFGTLPVLLAIEFALRARESGRVEHLLLSGLAAALMTSAKAFNLVLLLPWAAAVLPSLKLLLGRPALSGFAIAVSAVVSLLPTAFLNIRHCGDWTGLAAENIPQLAGGAPVFHVAVNAVLLLIQNLVPPVFPFVNAWAHLVDRMIPAGLAAKLVHYFESGGATFFVGEIQMEESAGLGFGVSLLLVFWLFSVRKTLPGLSRAVLTANVRKPAVLIPLCSWAAALFLLSRCGLSVPSRYLAPFYPLLLAPIFALWPVTKNYFTSRKWRLAVTLVFLVAVLPLVISPARPLWPALTLLRSLGGDSARPFVRRVWSVYSVYRQRATAFAPVVAGLPADADPLGLVRYDDPETSLWRPLGSRRILHVCDADTPDDLRRQGIKYVLVSGAVLAERYHTSIEAWLARHDAVPVKRIPLELKASKGSTDWFLVRIR